MAQSAAVLSAAPRKKRVWNVSFLDPLLYVQALAILLLLVLIVYPAGILLNLSVRDGSGAFSLLWYIQAYTTPRNYEAIVNTLVIGAGAAVLASVAGTFLAWAVVRTDMPGRRVMEIASVVPFISTPFIGALAWILLGSPETGLVNQFWRYLGGTGSLIEIYSIEGIIFVIALYEMPFVFLLVGVLCARWIRRSRRRRCRPAPVCGGRPPA